MRNKGFVKFLAIALTLTCLFYISFSVATKYVEDKAAKMSKEDAELYLDSLNATPFYLGNYTLKECREMAIGLGLDLKGGMNVILEVSVPDVIKTLADNKTDQAFVQALKDAEAEVNKSQDDFITLFIKSYRKHAPESRLAEIFATQQLKGKVTTQSNDAEVEKALREEVKAAIDNSFNVLRTRIDRFGVVQPNIQNLEGEMGRIMVELPGIKEPERVRKLLQGSANLEFWETYDTQDVLPYLNTLNSRLRDEAKSTLAANTDTTAVDTTAKAMVANNQNANDSAKASSSDLASKINAQAATSETKTAKSTELTDAQKAENPLFSILQPIQGNAGCLVGYALSRDTAEINAILNSKLAQDVLPGDMSLKWGVKATDKSGRVVELYAIKMTGKNGRAPLEGDVVVEAKDEYDNFGRPCVSMRMNTDGARKWAALTEANVGHAIAIVLDGFVYSAPNVNNKIDGGVSQITGNFTANDTKDLANVLQSGKMPAPAHIVQEDIVGPSLGQESINNGITSFVVAFVVLIFYMCIMYGFKPGMIANSALVINFFFTIGILTSLQAALTMSGIAGMVLSLGMAVDANVLIYERAKEELRAGKNVKNAVALGYSHAFSAIFDSNLTSVITGVILFNFGTGPIRGFATTLIIGIACSFFTAVWLTRIVYEHYLNKDKWTNLTFTTKLSRSFLQNPNFNFMSSYKKSFTIFGIALVVTMVSLAIRGLSQSIDFTGGRNFVVQFEKEVQPEQVRSLLENKMQDANVHVIALGTNNRTVRITTNYRIEENGNEVDSEIESIIYTALYNGDLLDKNVTLEVFIDRDNRAGGSIISSQKVGPSIAKDITYSAIWSVILALAAIFLYILLRFRNVAYSVGSVVALTLDTLLIIGAYSLCHGWIGFSLEIDQTFIGAILTAIGYSINDKVVIFDRVRENFKLYPNRDHKKLFNDSLNTTLTRTLNTSMSTLIVLLCIFILGGDSIRSFSFAMILGVCIGTLSSIFIAAPTAYLVMGRRIKETDAESNN